VISRSGDVSKPASRESSSTIAVAGIDLRHALQEHVPALLVVARAMSVDRMEAEELVQSTLETALLKMGQLREPDALRAWLFRIQTREALRLRRRLQVFVPWRGASTESASAVRSDHLDVRTALRQLPLRTRAAVVLHHMVGLSVIETAQAMGVSPNTVKTQLAKGLSILREELRDD
jgi:RNA polymerase sigma factor (sigma-70 family)